MKVIKEPPAAEPRRYDCCCGAVLEVERSDCHLVADDRDGNYFQFSCPRCRHLGTIAVSAWSVGGR